MGKRSRKRDSTRVAPVEPAVAPAPPRSRQRRARMDELPAPPWAPFPLVELCVLLGIVLMVVGVFAGGDRTAALVLSGVGLASLAGLEQALREHFAGFRSHTTLLAGFAAVIVLFAGGFAGLERPVVLAVAVATFAGAWYLLRRTFTRRSGGFGFRA